MSAFGLMTADLPGFLLPHGFMMMQWLHRMDRGENPPAHEKAFLTHRGTVAPDRVITLGEILEEVR